MVLALHLGVLLGEQPGLLRQLLVGLLQLALLGLQLGGELLGLLSSSSVRMVASMRVEHDADALGELLEEGQVDRGEAARSEASSMTALTSPSKSTGQHDDVPGPRPRPGRS